MLQHWLILVKFIHLGLIIKDNVDVNSAIRKKVSYTSVNREGWSRYLVYSNANMLCHEQTSFLVLLDINQRLTISLKILCALVLRGPRVSPLKWHVNEVLKMIPESCSSSRKSNKEDVRICQTNHTWKTDYCRVCVLCRECTGFSSACHCTHLPNRVPGELVVFYLYSKI